MPRKPGTPDKLTPEVQEAICAALEKPLPDKYAAELNGISEQLYYEWLRKGADGLEPYASFSLAVTRSRAKGAAKLTDQMLEGGKGCNMAAWLLERRYRKEYGPTQKIELGGDPDGVPLKIEDELNKLDVDDLRKLANAGD